MSSKLNLFSWIRESVKEAVLLGVSDAVEHLGEPGEDGGERARLLEVLRQSPERLERSGTAGEARPRRLGRTLRDLEPGQEKKAG